MILLTGAAGKTGKAIVNNLGQHGVKVRSLVRSAKQAEEIKNLGSADVFIGDLRDSDSLASALTGVSKIYFICPNMTPDELEIGKNLVNLARKAGVSRFVYHSVFHPQVEAMPHHWQKMRMEEFLFQSGMDFTILQPCAYMQNILGSWRSITDEGVYPVPYATTSRISIVDLADVAAVAEIVLTQRTHSGAIYELAGPEPLSQDEVAQILSNELAREVKAIALDRHQWTQNAQKSGMNELAINTLLKMFEYYENYGLSGNSNVLNYLLKRPATRFIEYVRRVVNLKPR